MSTPLARGLTLLVALSVCLGLHAAAVAQISVTDWTLSVSAGEAGGSDEVTHSSPAIPFGSGQNAIDGESTSSALYLFDVMSNKEALFEMAFDHARSGEVDSFAQAAGEITFTVGHNLTYEIDGLYQLAGEGNIELYVELIDNTDLFSPFLNLQNSSATLNQLFVVGGQDGDNSNDLSGSPTGLLAAGHEYTLVWFYDINNGGGGKGSSDPATALGELTLTLTPEPGTLALLLAGGLGLATRRRVV